MKTRFIQIINSRRWVTGWLLSAASLLRAADVVRSAAEPDYPPLSIVNSDGQAGGFTVDLLRAALKETGREVTFKVGPWAEIKQELADGKLEVLPLVGRTPEREALFDFTIPYLTLHGALFVRQDTTDIQTLDDLKGKRVAVMKGDNAEEYVRRVRLSEHIITTGSFEEAFQMLSAGRADAVIAQKLMGVTLLKHLGVANVRVVGKPNEEFKQDFCFAVRKGNGKLLAVLNEGLAIATARGISRQLEQQWLGVSERETALARVIVYGGDHAFPPYEFLDAKGRPAGLNIDLARAIARETGADISFQLAPWDDVRRKIENGEIDLASMFYSTQRERLVDFCIPHTLAHLAVFARNDAPRFRSIEDLKGRRIAVQNRDIMHDYAVQHGLGDTLYVTTTPEEALALLAAGQVEFALGEHLQGLYWINTNGWQNLRAIETRLLGTDYGYAVPKGNTALRDLLNDGLRQVQSNGEYRKICNQWLGVLEPDVSWWRTAKIILFILAAAALLATIAGGILFELRRQVRKRTAELVEANRSLAESQSVSQQRMEEAVQARNQLQLTQFALDHSAEAVFWIDQAGRFVYVNDAACRSLEFTAEELRQLSIHDINPDVPAGHWSAHWQEMKEKKVLRLEARHRTKDGRIFPVEIHANFLEFAVKEYICAFAHDITARKQAEAEHERMLVMAEKSRRALLSVLGDEKRKETERARLETQLLHAQKMEAVGRLAGGVAHDFNNMLQTILGNTELLLNDTAPDHPHTADLQEIATAARRSADLTRQLLAFARKQTIAPVVLDLNDAVADMLKMLHRLIGEDIDLRWKPALNLWSVKMDPSQLDQILANLTVNARDAIAGVGKVTIETANAELDENYCRNHADVVPGAYVMLAVSDTGCGMDAETQLHIFEPFFTTKEQGKGTGLGLATVFGIVKQNNGSITVYSEPGQGTTFKIYLPRYAATADEAEKALKPVLVPTGTETVLLVEDELALLRLARRLLELLGYTVLAAEGPSEAIRLAAEYAGDIHLLLTDVVMPGMSGRDLRERLSTARPAMKCLFMSGFTADAIARHGVRDEGLHFIQKPFAKAALAVKLREVLEEGRSVRA